MFIHEQSNVEIEANLDTSVIQATMRPQDLIPAFLEVIKNTPEYDQIMISNSPIVSLICDPTVEDEKWNNEDVSYFLHEQLWDVLNSYAPDGYYFGSHIGDGSDYGYWKNEEEL